MNPTTVDANPLAEALRAEFLDAYRAQCLMLFRAALLYAAVRDEITPATRVTPESEGALRRLDAAGRLLYALLCEWSQLGFVPTLDPDCLCCTLVAALLEYGAAQADGDRERICGEARRFVRAALVYAQAAGGGKK